MPDDLMRGLMDLLLTAIAAVFSWLLYEAKEYISGLKRDLRAKHTGDTVALLVDAAEMMWANPKTQADLREAGWTKLDWVLLQAQDRGLKIDRADVEAAIAAAKDVWAPKAG